MMNSHHFLYLLGSPNINKDIADKVLLDTKFKPLDSIDLTRQLIAHWWFNLYKGEARLKEGVYRSWSNAVSKYFKYIGPSGSSFTDGSGPSLRLTLEKDANVDEAISEYEFWQPYMKERQEEQLGIKGYFLNIFEYTLSEHCCYYLWVTDRKVYLTTSTYHCPDFNQKFDSLKEAFRYIKKNHYYPE